MKPFELTISLNKALYDLNKALLILDAALRGLVKGLACLMMACSGPNDALTSFINTLGA